MEPSDIKRFTKAQRDSCTFRILFAIVNDPTLIHRIQKKWLEKMKSLEEPYFHELLYFQVFLEVNPKLVGPLLIEIFDLQPQQQ